MIIGNHISDSNKTAFRIIFFLEYFSINLELNSWLKGPKSPAIEPNKATKELLALIAIANGEI